MEASLADLLRLGDLEGVTEAAFPTDGWSGATFTSMRDRFGNRFVLKRTSLAIDWIARATRDDRLREGWFAAMGPRALDPIAGTGVAYLGAAIDGDGVAMLMPAFAPLTGRARAGGSAGVLYGCPRNAGSAQRGQSFVKRAHLFAIGQDEIDRRNRGFRLHGRSQSAVNALYLLRVEFLRRRFATGCGDVDRSRLRRQGDFKQPSLRASVRQPGQ